MTENIFLDEMHPISRRFAVFEDDGNSAWLYLTEPNTRRPVADALVYNRIAPPRCEEVESFRPSPPPAASALQVKRRSVHCLRNTNGAFYGRKTGSRWR